MSRNVTASVVSSMYARNSSEGYVILLAIDHADLGSTIRLASTDTNFLSRGNTYLACPFEINLPPESPDRPPSVELQVQNVDRAIVAAIRTVTPGSAQPTVVMELVTLRLPDTIEAGPFNFSMKNASWDQVIVTAELSYEDILTEPYPVGSFTPGKYPGMFS